MMISKLYTAWERYTAVDPMVMAVPLNLISSNSTGTELLSLQISEKNSIDKTKR